MADTITTITTTGGATPTSNAMMLTMGLSSLGFAGGLFYAYKKDMGFWGYVGFGILGSIAGGAVGNIASAVAFKSK